MARVLKNQKPLNEKPVIEEPVKEEPVKEEVPNPVENEDTQNFEVIGIY